MSVKGPTLAFEHLSFSTPTRTILSSMSAVLEPCSVVAIMGPSGAGKTSLLNILAGRVGRDLTAAPSRLRARCSSTARGWSRPARSARRWPT
jgi:ABC-type uncharacterized transport system YnjBCD ATPase subunit